MKNFILIFTLLVMFATPALAVEYYPDQDEGSELMIGHWYMDTSPDSRVSDLKCRSGFGDTAYCVLTQNMRIDFNQDGDGDSDEGLLNFLQNLPTAADVAAKFNTPTGAVGQYIRGDGSLATFPSIFSGAWSDIVGKPLTFTPAEHAHDPIVAGAAVADAETNAIGNVVANLQTDYDVVNGVPALVDIVNASNVAHNDLATKYNSLVIKYNDAAVKLNTLILRLETQGLLIP